MRGRVLYKLLCSAIISTPAWRYTPPKSLGVSAGLAAAACSPLR